MSAPHWITNDPAAAKRLKAADARYYNARKAAADLPLAEKVAAFRLAADLRLAEYKVIGASS